jgi:GWxTD domain-containing protein
LGGHGGVSSPKLDSWRSTVSTQKPRVVPVLFPLLAGSILSGALSYPVAAQEADPVAATFARVKTSYKSKNMDEAERHLRILGELLADPAREAVRIKALPAYLFYSAAVAWERHDEARAKKDIGQYFTFVPEASIDHSSYPKSFVIFFEAQQGLAAKAAAAVPNGAPEGAGGVLGDYESRGLDPALVPAYSGEPEWIQGPVRHLLTDHEVKEFKKLQSDEDRRAFVQKFWEELDPDTRTPENELETECFRRLQYADMKFSTENGKGSDSDRGMVFLVLGPPSYVGRASLNRSQDPIQVLRETRITRVTNSQGRTASIVAPSGNAPLSVTEADGEVETWYYRRDRIPKGVPFTELRYLFISRPGYGMAVLQKEPRELAALRQSARLLRRGERKD